MVINDLSQYLTCIHNCTLQYLEALAMNGFAKKAYIEDCERKNFQRIVLELYSGDKIVSECRFSEEIVQSLRIINVYIGISRKNNAWEKLEITESPRTRE